MTQAVIAHHACLAGGPGQGVKDTPHTRLTLVRVGGFSTLLCVKEYRWRSRGYRLKDVVRPSQARREWLNGARLRRMGVLAARPLALVEPPLRAKSSYYVVTEALDDVRRLDWHLYLALNDHPDAHRWKARFIPLFARYLRDLHHRGVGHRDMKPSNILVRETGDGWDFFLIDLADVRFGRPASYRQRVLNLAQLNAAAPMVVTRTDRWRFLNAYLCGLEGVPPRERFWRDVLGLTLTRRCIWQRDRPVE